MQDSFDLYGAALPKEFHMGCLKIRNAHLWRLSHVVWTGSAKSVGATFFCDLKEPWDDRNLLRVETYRLPRASTEFAERCQWYTSDRKKRRIKIADGQLFDEAMLHMPTFGEGWEMDSFALSKSEVIRIYRTKRYAVIFRFLARSGTLLDHPIFKRLAKDITFDAQNWERKAPEITEKRKKSKVVDSPLSKDEERELKQIVKTADKRLGIRRTTSTADRIVLVEKEIERTRAAGKVSDEMKSDLAMELGARLGQCFCEELDWEWRRLMLPDGTDTVCVCCPERRLVLSPGSWVSELLSSKKRPLNGLLTFNMISAGRLPPTRPNAYTRIN